MTNCLNFSHQQKFKNSQFSLQNCFWLLFHENSVKFAKKKLTKSFLCMESWTHTLLLLLPLSDDDNALHLVSALILPPRYGHRAGCRIKREPSVWHASGLPIACALCCRRSRGVIAERLSLFSGEKNELFSHWEPSYIGMKNPLDCAMLTTNKSTCVQFGYLFRSDHEARKRQQTGLG
jgi:hypothetical protein